MAGNAPLQAFTTIRLAVCWLSLRMSSPTENCDDMSQ